jgi:hypothetical protein
METTRLDWPSISLPGDSTANRETVVDGVVQMNRFVSSKIAIVLRQAACGLRVGCV